MNADKVLPDVLSSLSYPGKGYRVCDVQLDFPLFSEEEIEAALEKALVDGLVEKDKLTAPGVPDQVIYFKKI